MSSWKKIILSIPIFIFLLLGVITFLVGTTSGLHLVFNAVNHWVSGLEIGQITGGWRDLHLKNICYKQSGIIVEAAELHLAMKLGCLQDRKLCVNNLSLKDVSVTVDSEKMPTFTPIEKEDGIPISLSIPYPITFYRIALNNVNIKINNTAISITDFRSGLRWQKKDVFLMPTSMQGLLITLPKMTNSSKKKIVELKQNTQLQKKLISEKIKNFFSKSMFAMMTDIHIPVNLNIEEFKGEQLRLIGDTDLTIFKILVKMSSINDNMQLDTLDIVTNQGSVKATGNAILRDNWPVEFILSGMFNINPLKGEKVKLKIDGALRDKLKLSVNLSGPLDMMLIAQTSLTETGLPLNLEIASKKLFHTLLREKQLEVYDVKLNLSGKMTDYILSFCSALKRHDMQPATISLDAKGNVQKINLNKLTTITALEGKTKLTSVVNWRYVISWHSALKITGINTVKESPDWPSTLDGLITINGSLCDGNWRIDIPEIKLTGKMKQNKVRVDGSLRGSSYLKWAIPGLHITLGSNTATIKGELGIKNLDLEASIDAPNLNNILPELNGRLKGLVKIHGAIESPELLLDITGNSFRWQYLSIAYIRIDGNVKPTKQINSKLNIHIERISQPGVNIGLLKLSAKGSEKRHDLQLYVQSDPIYGRLHLIGSFDRKTKYWKGQLDDIRFNTPIGPLGLSQAQAIQLDYRKAEQKIRIGPHCWINPNAELCIPKTINAMMKGHALVNLNRFDLAIIKPFIASTTEIRGVFVGKADIAWDIRKGGIPQGSLTLSGRNVQVTRITNKIPLAIAFGILSLSVNLHDNCIQLDWLMRLINNGQFAGQVKVSDLWRQCNLSGNVRMHEFNLSIVNMIFAHSAKIAGLLNTDLRLGGNVKHPQLFGQVQFYNIDIDGNFMPFDMQSSWLMMNFNGIHATLAGIVRTSQGQINLRGNADWDEIDNWRARIVAKSTDVRIAISPMILLNVSSNVMFEATPNLLTLDGSVNVPWARIVIHDVPESVVSVSSDEVLLNKNLKPIEKKSTSMLMNGNVVVHLGNNVQLEAFGLKTRLTGNLIVAWDKRGMGLNGQINIAEGRFHAYGQDLIERKGELLFSGPPDRPVLNIEAIRNPNATEDNVIAGVRITGFANEPKTEIFSDPAMSEQEALSYLLRGQGLGNDQSSSAMIRSILVGLGVSKSRQVIGKIGETLGVSNLALDTQGVGDSSQVVVSGYLLPSLQVKCGVGIFDSLATFTLRYRLMPKLYLEAVSGSDQTLDLLYQFEF